MALRLLLDAHVSGRKIGKRLAKDGHDVLAVDSESALEGLRDEDLLQLAAEQKRIVLTFDVKDFPDITTRWVEAGKHHCGCAAIVGIDHSEFGVTLRILRALFEQRPSQKDWLDYTCFVSRHQD